MCVGLCRFLSDAVVNIFRCGGGGGGGGMTQRTELQLMLPNWSVMWLKHRCLLKPLREEWVCNE